VGARRAEHREFTSAYALLGRGRRSGDSCHRHIPRHDRAHRRLVTSGTPTPPAATCYSSDQHLDYGTLSTAAASGKLPDLTEDARGANRWRTERTAGS